MENFQVKFETLRQTSRYIIVRFASGVTHTISTDSIDECTFEDLITAEAGYPVYMTSVEQCEDTEDEDSASESADRKENSVEFMHYFRQTLDILRNFRFLTSILAVMSYELEFISPSVVIILFLVEIVNSVTERSLMRYFSMGSSVMLYSIYKSYELYKWYRSRRIPIVYISRYCTPVDTMFVYKGRVTTGHGCYSPLETKLKMENAFNMVHFIVNHYVYIMAALVAVLFIMVVWLCCRGRTRKAISVKYQSPSRLERAMPGSDYEGAPEPSCQAEIIGQVAGSKVLLGQGFLLNVSKDVEDFMFVTAQHVIGEITELYIKKGDRFVEITSDLFKWVEGTDMMYYPMPHRQVSAVGLKPARPVDLREELTTAVHAFQQRTHGVTKHAPTFGRVIYMGSSREGFSGAPYLINNRVVGMHTGSCASGNQGYSIDYINCNILLSEKRRYEDTGDNLFRAYESGEQVEVRYTGDPETLQARYKGKYYNIKNDEKNRSMMKRNHSVRVPETKESMIYDNSKNLSMAAGPSHVNVRQRGLASETVSRVPSDQRSSTNETQTYSFPPLSPGSVMLITDPRMLMRALPNVASKSTSNTLTLEDIPVKSGKSTKKTKPKTTKPPKQ